MNDNDSFLTIQGPTQLKGEVKISGAKNASLPIIISSLLFDGKITLDNIPNISDVINTFEILKLLNVKVKYKENNQSLHINTESIKIVPLPKKVISVIRASIWFLPVLLFRSKSFTLFFPGGCKIGDRKVDLHIDLLKKIGINVQVFNDKIICNRDKNLTPLNYSFNKNSVGATINAICFAAFINGESKLYNCSVEPEVVDLCNFFLKAGKKILGVGKSTLKIIGDSSKKIDNIDYTVISDRIEAVTYAIASGITQGKLVLKNINYHILDNVIPILEKTGMQIKILSNYEIEFTGVERINSVDISTNPYPGFSTDMQPMFMSLMCFAKGKSIISENIYNKRFHQAYELNKMGAKISCEDNKAIVYGNNKALLNPSRNLFSHNLRCGATMLIASLMARGESRLFDVDKIYRGYSSIVSNLISCSAKIYSQEEKR